MPTSSAETPEESCVSCLKAKKGLKNTSRCGICQQMSCKDCTQFLDADAFSFLAQVSEDLQHRTYCRACYDEKVAPELAIYAQAMERAAQIFVFYKKHEYLQVIRRSKKIISVRDCKDKRDVLLRLAFVAAQQSYNALVDVELIPEKVQISGYQTTNWTGTGFPADVRPEKERQ